MAEITSISERVIRDLVEHCRKQAHMLYKASTALAELDLLVAFAYKSRLGNYGNVPAEEAVFPLVQCILTHFPQQDARLWSHSQFRKEMLNAAFMLNHRDLPRSLVVIDELARSTSPIDGESIAYTMVCEFVSHKMENHEHGQILRFPHTIEPASDPPASHYGIMVASMLDFPPTLIENALEVAAKVM
ncbi:hypothetical protein IWQ62_004246 [Dispira parvispora]|uniref:DNA mismatch repair proteins mutS family domain-containing protein n=1 Tax=Dispira parvispora TaxID=1520584 RepID=A0A9W8E5S9_9FUNG|nr:hypothetical protein IWQ62_004246 [Dispira parvispora]